MLSRITPTLPLMSQLQHKSLFTNKTISGFKNPVTSTNSTFNFGKHKFQLNGALCVLVHINALLPHFLIVSIQPNSAAEQINPHLVVF